MKKAILIPVIAIALTAALLFGIVNADRKSVV